jgi:hypothetical protein
MKELSEGDLPESGSEVAVWYDEEEDVVSVQLDFLDLNFFASDFGRLIEILERAKAAMENDLDVDLD